MYKYLAFLFAFITPTVWAADNNGYYLSLDLGMANSGGVCKSISKAGGFSNDKCEDSSASYSLGIGYRMQHLGAEIQLQSLDSFVSKDSSTTGDANVNLARVVASGYLNAGRLDWDGFARGGLAVWNSEQENSGLISGKSSNKGVSLTFGVGGLYSVNNFSLLVAWDYINGMSTETGGEKFNAGIFSLGARINL